MTSWKRGRAAEYSSNSRLVATMLNFELFWRRISCEKSALLKLKLRWVAEISATFYCANKKVRFPKWPNSPLKMISSFYCALSRIFLFFFCVFCFASCKTSQNGNISQLPTWSKVKVSKQPMRSGRSSLLRSFLNNFAVVKINGGVGKKASKVCG